MAMGDGANDVPMLRAAGFAIVIGGRAVALAEADAAVREGDLSVVTGFLGLTDL
jgi:phosphoserine phosphatase